MEEVKKASSSKKPLIAVGIAVLILLLVIAAICLFPQKTENETPKIITTASLSKIIKESELSTSTAIYNGVAEVYNEKNPKKVDCHVAYHAKVSAGIDFGEVKIEVDNEGKTVSITIPEVHITNIDVDVGTMDFMFENPKADASAFTAKALKACEEDVKEESAQQTAITDLARQNAVNAITGWTKPFIDDVDHSYMLIVK